LSVGVPQHISDYRVDSIPSWHRYKQSPQAVDRNKLGDVFQTGRSECKLVRRGLYICYGHTRKWLAWFRGIKYCWVLHLAYVSLF